MDRDRNVFTLTVTKGHMIINKKCKTSGDKNVKCGWVHSLHVQLIETREQEFHFENSEQDSAKSSIIKLPVDTNF
jgi:hypothetical protein